MEKPDERTQSVGAVSAAKTNPNNRHAIISSSIHPIICCDT